MTDPTPPPLPKKACCGGAFLPFLAGLAIGGGIASAGGYAFVRYDRIRTERALAEMQQAGQFMQDAVGGIANASGITIPGAGKNKGPSAGDAEKIKALGDETVEDLRAGRALLVYRHLTPELQKKTSLEEFEKKYVEANNVRNIGNTALRQSKVRKAAEGNDYEYYCTASIWNSQSNSYSAVNIAFTFNPADGDWLISDVQMKYTQ